MYTYCGHCEFTCTLRQHWDKTISPAPGDLLIKKKTVVFFIDDDKYFKQKGTNFGYSNAKNAYLIALVKGVLY